MASLVISVIIVYLWHSVNCKDLWLMAPWQYVASTTEIMNLWFETRMQSVVEFKTKYPIFKPMNAFMRSPRIRYQQICCVFCWTRDCDSHLQNCKHSSRCPMCTQWDKFPQIHGTNSFRPSYTGVNDASTLTLQINLMLKPISEWMSVIDSDIFWPGEVKNH